MADFETGTLRRLIQSRTSAALECGALCPLETALHTVRASDTPYLIRVAVRSDRKPREAGSRGGKQRNPFLPFDEELFVADVSDSHVALLNKFNVVSDHVLLVTRSFENQSTRLGANDFYAWARCLNEFDALGFYNSGPVGGASQPHRHLQLVPLPLEGSTDRLPLEPAIVAALTDDNTSGSQLIESTELPYRHRLVHLSAQPPADPIEMAEEMAAQYSRMSLDLEQGQAEPASYNLLLTRQWMLMVPRTRECYKSISLNALAFAGAFFVHRETDLALLSEGGLLHALRSVTHNAI